MYNFSLIFVNAHRGVVGELLSINTMVVGSVRSPIGEMRWDLDSLPNTQCFENWAESVECSV